MITLLFVGFLAFGGQSEFCEGFKVGYQSIKGINSIVPLCPIAPITPINSTDYLEGIKMGIKLANS